MGPDISDFEDYGDSGDWPSVSDTVDAGGPPGGDASATWTPTRAAHVRAAGRCEGFPPRTGGTNAGAIPYEANPGQRFHISPSDRTIQGRADGSADYEQLRLIRAGADGPRSRSLPKIWKA